MKSRKPSSAEFVAGTGRCSRQISGRPEQAIRQLAVSSKALHCRLENLAVSQGKPLEGSFFRNTTKFCLRLTSKVLGVLTNDDIRRWQIILYLESTSAQQWRCLQWWIKFKQALSNPNLPELEKLQKWPLHSAPGKIGEDVASSSTGKSMVLQGQKFDIPAPSKVYKLLRESEKQELSKCKVLQT